MKNLTKGFAAAMLVAGLGLSACSEGNEIENEAELTGEEAEMAGQAAIDDMEAGMDEMGAELDQMGDEMGAEFDEMGNELDVAADNAANSVDAEMDEMEADLEKLGLSAFAPRADDRNRRVLSWCAAVFSFRRLCPGRGNIGAAIRREGA